MVSYTVDLHATRAAARVKAEKKEREGQEMITFRSGLSLKDNIIPGYLPPAKLPSATKKT